MAAKKKVPAKKTTRKNPRKTKTVITPESRWPFGVGHWRARIVVVALMCLAVAAAGFAIYVLLAA